MRFVIIMSVFLSLFNPLKKYDKTELAMGTVVTITLFDKSGKGNLLIEEAFKIASEYEKLFSSKDSESILYKYNIQKNAVIENNEILKLINDSLYYAQLTEGTFDPALKALISIWDFEKIKEPPSNELIKYAQSRSGYKNIKLSDNKLYLANEASIDLGAIAKGRIIEKMAEFLTESGITNFMINAGGDIAVSGLYNGKRKWNIAIADPYNRSRTAGFIRMTDKSIVTSGDYERYFTASDNRRYHHIIDPFTGYPADNGLNSVTVISSDSTKADALSTAFFVMGLERALEAAEKLDDVEAVFIYKKEQKTQITVTSGIKTVFHENLGFEFILSPDSF